MNYLHLIRLIIVSLLISLALSCNGDKSPKLIAILSLFTDSTSTVTYTVGGTVQGLIGTLGLQNNGSETINLSADGNFTFPTGLTDGVTYSVTVLTQPTGQTCIASSNVGSISGSDVTNISIICTTNTYTVGGNISGLVGTVVLQNNAGDNLSLSANGSFTFATSVAHGANYLISVFTQPGTVTCSTSNNAGTINAANVTNVSVVCSNASYTVGGNLSGLSGTVILQNNASDNLTLSANGGFTFSTNVADGGNYSVTVLTQPATRNCVITNGTGTISSANISNIVVTCTGNANGPLVSGTIINPLTLTGGVTTFVGAPCADNTSGCASPNGYVDSATPNDVRFRGALGITTDGFNLYIAEKDNCVIRKVVIATRVTSTLAGDGNCALLDGIGTAARFKDPQYLVTDGTHVYVADKNNKAIRKIVISTGVVSTIISGSNDLGDPKGMVIYNNNLYLGDKGGNALRQINLSTNALTTVVVSGLSDPTSMTLVGTDIYITDKGSNLIKKTTIGVWTLSTFAGTTSGLADGTGTTGTKFKDPEGITNDGTNLYVSDTGNHAIRKIVISTAVVTTVAGTDNPNYSNSSTSTSARFDTPQGITSDGANVYVMDEKNNAVRLIQ